MSRPKTELSWRDVAALLSGTVGWEKSVEAVQEAALSLGLDSSHLSEEQVSDVLTALARSTGIVGVTARFVRSRPLPAKPGLIRPEAVPPSPRTQTVRKTSARIPRAQLVALLSPTVGLEKAEEVFTTACRSLGLSEASFSNADALALFELLASYEGLVGVTARFAKARLALLSS